ncbi:MAG: hypothetical protein JST54_18940 [Deltaproteobacteria bacterium]|nr:hypothetical protein [Deltaproteobacteria bacterium]
MPRGARSRLVLSFFALAVVGFSPCGAEDKDSPTKSQAAQHPEACKTFSELAPSLNSALQNDGLDGARSLVTQLSQPPAEGGAPPINQVLEALFVALNEFAQDPPESGNTDGLCNEDTPPPLDQTNRLCDLRRILKIYIHEGKASQSLHAFDPVIAGTLDYIIGVQPSSDVPHYEIARDLEIMCTQTGECDAHDTFDLVQGITAYLSPAHASQLLTDTQALIDDPALGGLFSSVGADGGSSGNLGEAGFEEVADLLLCAIGEVDPNAPADQGGPFAPIDQLLNGTLYPLVDSSFPDGAAYDLPDGGVAYSHLHTEIANAAADLEQMLDPNASEPVLQPLQATMQCATVPGSSLCGKVVRPGFVQMIYHLGFEAKVIGLDEIFAALQELITIDAQSEEPGMVMRILHDIAAALNRDDEALSALTNLCHVAFQTERPCDDGKGDDCPSLPLNYFPPQSSAAPHLDNCSNGAGVNYSVPDKACMCNAEAVTPEVATLFEDGITDEVFCVLDVLVYGCAGGTSPSCVVTTTK